MPSQRSSGGRGNDSTSRGGRGSQGRGRGRHRRPQQPHQKPKFKGNCAELQGFLFDCSDYKQADNFVNTLKRVSEHVGAEFKHGGDIRSSIINGKEMNIPIPVAPSIVNPAAPTPEEQVLQMIFKGEIDAYIKRKSVLEDNIQKAYLLVLGQCTNLLQSKLKQQSSWAQVSID